MAKKTTKKSQRARTQRARVPQTSFDQPVRAAASAQKAAVAAPAYKRGEAVNFKEEYRYVLKDLKRLAIIAVVMLVVLVALSLLLA
jgi:hypothetical protein